MDIFDQIQRFKNENQLSEDEEDDFEINDQEDERLPIVQQSQPAFGQEEPDLYQSEQLAEKLNAIANKQQTKELADAASYSQFNKADDHNAAELPFDCRYTSNKETYPPNSTDHNSGKKISFTYSAERVVGHGSFGIVFVATVAETGELVAIKKVL